jgi:type II secretory pathway pseudopilin PulG
MIEIVISMFLFGLVAVAILPLLISSMQATARNSVVAVATQVAAQQLEQMRASGSSCSAVKAFASTLPAVVPNGSNPLQPHLHLTLPAGDTCVSPYLRTVPLRIWVTEVGSPNPLADVASLILLDAP